MKACRYLRLHGHEDFECLYWDGNLTPVEAMRCYTPGNWSPDCYEEDDNAPHPELDYGASLNGLLDQIYVDGVPEPFTIYTSACHVCSQPPGLQREGSWYECYECRGHVRPK